VPDGVAERFELADRQVLKVQSLLRVWATRVISAAKETKTSLAMHVAILEAIEKQDADGTRAAMTAHMDRTGRRLRATIAEPE